MEEARERVELLIEDAEALIEGAFLRCGRRLDYELEHVPWLRGEVVRVLREMLAAAVIIGPSAGRRSVSSMTGGESDSVTFTDEGLNAVSFGGVKLTDAQRVALGLCMPGAARGRFPRPIGWPEPTRRRGWS